jgi:hypothetical protein
MTQALARAEPLSDRQLRARLEIARGKGFTLEGATREQLNMVYLVAQRYALDPLTHVGLFQGKPWYTLDGRIYLARRHPQFRGLKTRPLTSDEKAAWGYRSDDLVVECTMHTKDWGDITARGKVTAAERSKNTPTGSHPQEMAEKRAIARASRLAFGLEIPDETDAEVADAERNEARKLGADNERYTEIFGSDENHSPYELEPAGSTSAQELTEPEPSSTVAAAPPPRPSPPSDTPLVDKYARNRELIKRARELGVSGFDPLKLGQTDDVVDAANLDLEDRIARAEWEQEEVARQRAKEGLL